MPATGVSVGVQVSVRSLYQQLKGGCDLRSLFVQVPATGKIQIQGQPTGRLSV